MQDEQIPEKAGKGRAGAGFRLYFTPAEWRSLLNDAGFLSQPDNSYSPRRLMGLPVEIIAGHGSCGEVIGWSSLSCARKS